MPDNFLENFFLPRHGKSYEVAQRTVSPFSEEQVGIHLSHYVKYSPEAVWGNVAAYSEKLTSVPGLQHLTRIPFTLRMVLGILPVLTEGAMGNFTQSRLFDE
jgi:hypothetical protein